MRCATSHVSSQTTVTGNQVLQDGGGCIARGLTVSTNRRVAESLSASQDQGHPQVNPRMFCNGTKVLHCNDLTYGWSMTKAFQKPHDLTDTDSFSGSWSEQPIPDEAPLFRCVACRSPTDNPTRLPCRPACSSPFVIHSMIMFCHRQVVGALDEASRHSTL